MPNNSIIHNTGGSHRFLDFVSELPEFLQEEEDVITLMQIFSDYLNNAYRNTTIATRFTFKLIAVDSNVGSTIERLGLLAELFIQSEFRNLPIVYMIPPKNPVIDVIDYTNTLTRFYESECSTLVSGAVSVGDRYYFEFINYPQDSGVYKIVDIGGVLKFAEDPDSASQDPFTRTPDKPYLSDVGYVPRMVQFNVSDITKVRSRKADVVDGLMYFEVFFDATITDVESISSIESLDVTIDLNGTPNNGKYLVDYYNTLGDIYPANHKPINGGGGKFDVEFASCNAFALGRGIFYARGLTKSDRREVMVDGTGDNKYIDPYYKYRGVNCGVVCEPQDALYYTKEVNSLNMVNLIVPYHNIEYGCNFSIGDYIVRVESSDAQVAMADMASIDIIDNRIYVDNLNGMFIGDRVKIVGSTGSIMPSGLINNTTHVISDVDLDSNYLVLSGVNLTAIGLGNLTITRIIKSQVDIGYVSKVTSTYIELSSFSGDLISVGEIAKINNGKIIFRADINNNIIVWDGLPNTYYSKNTYVYYMGVVYRLIEAFNTGASPIPPPDISSRYVVDMTSLVTPKKIVDTNPYMFGAYTGKSLSNTESINFAGEGFSELIDDIFVQESHDVGFKYYHDQREWLFNPVVATSSDTSRNGWVEFIANRNEVYDIVAADATAYVVVSMTQVNNFVTVRLDVTHGYDTSMSVTIAGSDMVDYNGTFRIHSIIDAYTFTYKLPSSNANNPVSPATGTITANVNQLINGTVIYSRQNLFGVTDNNPNNPDDGVLILSNDVTYNSGVVTVNTTKAHNYITGTLINISGLSDDVYNGTFEISTVPNSTQFTYLIAGTPSSPATGIALIKSYVWYKYTLNNIEWQYRSKLNSVDYTVPSDKTYHQIVSNNNLDNVRKLVGEYSTTLSGGSNIKFTSGDIVELNDQYNINENGVWLVVRGARWRKLDTRRVLKILDISVDSTIDGDLVIDGDPYIYTKYRDIDVNAAVGVGTNVYRVASGHIRNASFYLPVVSGIDTTDSYHKRYDARYDTNSVYDFTGVFKGIGDMDYPIMDKIERLAYLRDPNIIDFQVIGYLARFMGYDITPVMDDVTESSIYKNDIERDMVIRKIIQYLPEFNALKSTTTGLEMLLLTFGIVGKVINLWTSQNAPYREFIPDYLVDDYRYNAMADNKYLSLISTPHFAIQVDVESNFDNQLTLNDIGRITNSVIKYKPINTVFDGISAYMRNKAYATISITAMDAIGRASADIGYNINFQDYSDSCSI